MTSTLRTVWVAVAVALAVWLAVALVMGAAASGHNDSARHKAQTRTHFYRVIAGQDNAGPAVNDALAGDLRQFSRDRLRLFEGTANKYGGITAEIGVNPFTNECGRECGHLTSSMLQDVEASRDGHPPVAKSKVTEISKTLPLVLLFLWGIVGVVLAVAQTATPRLRERQRKAALRRTYPDECQLLDRIDKAIALIPAMYSQASREQREQRVQLEDLHERIEHGLYQRIDPRVKESEVSQMRLKHLLAEANDVLVTIESGDQAAIDS